jgi:hypothetical protein
MTDLSPECAPKRTFTDASEFVGAWFMPLKDRAGNVDQFAGMRGARH